MPWAKFRFECRFWLTFALQKATGGVQRLLIWHLHGVCSQRELPPKPSAPKPALFLARSYSLARQLSPGSNNNVQANFALTLFSTSNRASIKWSKIWGLFKFITHWALLDCLLSLSCLQYQCTWLLQNHLVAGILAGSKAEKERGKY